MGLEDNFAPTAPGPNGLSTHARFTLHAEDSAETVNDIVAELALPQKFATDAPVEKLLTHVAMSKPKRVGRERPAPYSKPAFTAA